MTMFLASAVPAVAVAVLGWVVAAWARSSAGRVDSQAIEEAQGRHP